MNFTFVQNESWITVQRQTHHLQPLMRTGIWRFAVGRCSSGNEKNGAQVALLYRFLRKAQMPVVDGVEGAAEYANGCDGYHLQRQPAHVSQHLSQVGGETRTCGAIYHAVVIG